LMMAATNKMEESLVHGGAGSDYKSKFESNFDDDESREQEGHPSELCDKQDSVQEEEELPFKDSKMSNNSSIVKIQNSLTA
ncbi:hypothetical protein DXG03_009676, partial [Asterophora parasitica]